jgi:hypothetical protein
MMADPVSNLTLSDLVTGGKPAAPPKVKASTILADIRQKFPAYQAVPDDRLLMAVHQHEYPGMTAAQFYGGIDFDNDRARLNPTNDMGTAERFAAGMGKPVADTWGGIKRIGNMAGIGDYDQAAAQQDQELDKPLMDTTAGKFGDLAGNLMLTAIPVAKGTQVATRGITTAARALPRVAEALGAGARAMPYVQGTARTVARLAPPTAAAMTGAAMGALQSPEDMERGAEFGALGGAGGDLVGRVLTRTLGGIASGMVSPEARALMDQGVRVPLWKATDNRIVRGAADAAKAIPIAGQLMKNAERQAATDWNGVLMRGATPGQPVMDEAGNILRWDTSNPVTDVGQQGMRQLRDRFGQAYDAIYGTRVLPAPGLNGAIGDLTDQARAYTPSIAGDVQGAAQRAMDTLNEGVAPTVTRTTTGGNALGSGRISSRMTTPTQTATSTTLNHAGATANQYARALGDLDEAISNAWASPGGADRAHALQQIRDVIDAARSAALPPEVQAMLPGVNAAYGNFKTLQRASAMLGAAKNEGVVSPGQLMNSIKAGDRTAGKRAFSEGTARGQQAAQQAEGVLGSSLPEVGPGTAEKLGLLGTLGALGHFSGWTPTIAAGLMATAPGQRFLAGGNAWQAYVRAHPDVIARYLRTAGAAGANDANDINATVR